VKDQAASPSRPRRILHTRLEPALRRGSRYKRTAHPTAGHYATESSLYRAINAYDIKKLEDILSALEQDSNFAAIVLASEDELGQSHLLRIIWLWGPRTSISLQTFDVLFRLLNLPLDQDLADHEGFSPPMCAALVPRVDLVSLLLPTGPDIKRTTREGLTAVDLVVVQAEKSHDFTDVVNILRRAKEFHESMTYKN
jgi:hypothetical protein